MSILPITAAFQKYLADERHFSPYTARCYGADLRQFVDDFDLGVDGLGDLFGGGPACFVGAAEDQFHDLTAKLPGPLARRVFAAGAQGQIRRTGDAPFAFPRGRTGANQPDRGMCGLTHTKSARSTGRSIRRPARRSLVESCRHRRLQR